jgi:hypothetical protein
MSLLPDDIAYADAIQEHGDHPVHVNTSVIELTMLLTTLQLALRHPEYPETMRPYVEAFLDGAIANLTRLSPIIGQVMAAGNDLTLDED